MLLLRNVTFSYGAKTILDSATVALPASAKVAMVGRNGTGKSTLLKLIDGELHSNGGEIEIASKTRLERLRQDSPDPSMTVLQLVLSGHSEMAALQAKLDAGIDDPMEMAETHSRLEDLGIYAAEAKAARILNGLGFKDSDFTRPIGDFSGGWQMRAALGGLLFSEPDYMLLDEPTNYLDLEGAMWLENYLSSYPRGWVMVSHDKDMLNAAPSHILHLVNGKLTLYTGGYDSFAKQFAEKQILTQKANVKLTAERARLTKFIDRFRAQATKAKQAQSRVKALQRLGTTQSVVSEGSVSFTFPQVEPLPPPMIHIEEAAVGYGDNPPVLKNLNLRLDGSDRVALLGPNGRGKSTFAKLLSNRLQARSGKVRRSSKLKVGFFAQNQMDELIGNDTPLAHMARALPKLLPGQHRSRLARFGFDADMVERRVDSLSGGEKARLLFAIITAENPQFLILDEPTNHLDIAAREELAKAIGEYNGAVLMISHDRALIDLCADRLWEVKDGTVKAYDGEMDDYRKQLLQGDAPQSKKQEGTPSERKAARKEAAKLRAQLAPLRKHIKACENAMEQVERRVSSLKTALEDPELYEGSDHSKAMALQKDLAEAEAKLEKAEAEWMDAQEKLEAAEAEQAALTV